MLRVPLPLQPVRLLRDCARRAMPIVLLLGLAPLAQASNDPSTSDPPDPMAPGLTHRERLDALVERVKLEQGRVETMEAEFVQDKLSSLLVEPDESRGVFSYKAPESVRWEYRSPKPIVMVIDGKQLTTWYQDLGTAERAKVERYTEQVFKYLGASGSLETLMEYFELQVAFPSAAGEPYVVDLLPLYPRIAKRLQSMRLWIDGKLFLPVRLKYVEPNGDHTEYRFENLTLNQDIPSERFELQLPPDVKVRIIELGS